MKHKYKVGESVVLIYDQGRELLIENGTIRSDPKNIIADYNYQLNECGGVWTERQLYTPLEAIEFIANYINEEKWN